MAGSKREVVPEEVMAARRVAELVADELVDVAKAGQSKKVDADSRRARRIEAMALRLAGFSYEQVAERFDVSAEQIERWMHETMESAEAPNVATMRSLENQRLDRAQSAIWSQVVAGNLKAVDTFMRLSQQRSKINGLYAPTKIDLNIGIRHEMEAALSNLESLVSQQADILDADIVEETAAYLRSPDQLEAKFDADL